MLELLLQSDPNGDQRPLREALVEWLRGEVGPAVKAWRQARAARLQRWQVDETWRKTEPGRAERLDGVRLDNRDWSGSGGATEDADPVDKWTVFFRPLPGGLPPTRTIRASSLVDACEQVDTVWPMAEWVRSLYGPHPWR
ncbi:MAG: hypothetical protein H6739_07800 [Alphaproteobacteria bacterium]|nr:hypothetical protein [Alphaproteobacteria bacterium]